jgi:hypothetical protein
MTFLDQGFKFQRYAIVDHDDHTKHKALLILAFTTFNYSGSIHVLIMDVVG